MLPKAKEKARPETTYSGTIIGVDLEETLERLSVAIDVKGIWGMSLYYVRGKKEIRTFLNSAGVSDAEGLKDREVRVYYVGGRAERVEYLP